jgi:hypothetical protein
MNFIWDFVIEDASFLSVLRVDFLGYFWGRWGGVD